MQNNPLETKRAHRDKVGVKAATAAKKSVQGGYYNALVRQMASRVKIPPPSFEINFFSRKKKKKKKFLSTLCSFRYLFFDRVKRDYYYYYSK